MKIKYKNWTLIPWDGNLALGYMCYRKSFGRGYVSVGVGDFKNITYSHGPDSDESLSSTRWRAEKDISEEAAMAHVDKNKGFYKAEKI